MTAAPNFDMLIVGGGLSGGLCVLALAARRPELRVGLVEPGTIGGNHIWSFFESDVAAHDRELIEPLITQRWPGYSVRFPAFERRLDQPYRSITSDRLDVAVRAALPPETIIRATATALTATSVTLDSGETLHARAVIDARGGRAEGLTLGWQKFVGQRLHIPQGHGLTEPIVMDASVDQADGYRFVYALPFDATHLFVEDTYYTDGPALDRDLLAERIGDYAAARGWQIAAREQEEGGVLPVVIGGDFDQLWPAADPVARAGVRGGMFHHLTSYSLPEAVRFAAWLAEEAPLDDLAAATRARAKRHWRRSWFDRLLGRMLFGAAEPADRYRVLQRFYRLSPTLIARFYAGRSTPYDRFRILAGKPPVPILRALRVLRKPK